MSHSLFTTPFEQALDPKNRWVRMSYIIPWDEFAGVFFKRMSEKMGSGTIDLRIVIGALLVKHIENLSDKKTIEYIQENVYAQYFVGLRGFQTTPVFVPSLFVEIRKRLSLEGVKELNDKLLVHSLELGAIKHRKKRVEKSKESDDGEGNKGEEIMKADDCTNESDDTCKEQPEMEKDSCFTKEGDTTKEKADDNGICEGGEAPDATKNRGTMKADATVAPQNIAYPTDTALLAKARVYTEGLLDKLWESSEKQGDKPRTYRREADGKYTNFSKKRKPGKKAIRTCCKEQLNYLKRNIGHINRMLDMLLPGKVSWTHADWRLLWVISELHRQQEYMYNSKTKKIDDRIVCIHQPHIRPIKRGKSGKRDTEFGCKINVSETEGFARLDQASFDNFNESVWLGDQLEAYRRLYGYYPELVLVDKIYLTAKNRKLLKSLGIRHAGTPLGRPPKMNAKEKRKRKKEQDGRATIEGKFGQAKTGYGMDRIKMGRKDTSLAAIGLIIIAVNIVRLLKALPCHFLRAMGHVLSYMAAPIRAFKCWQSPVAPWWGQAREKAGLAPGWQFFQIVAL